MKLILSFLILLSSHTWADDYCCWLDFGGPDTANDILKVVNKASQCVDGATHGVIVAPSMCKNKGLAVGVSVAPQAPMVCCEFSIKSGNSTTTSTSPYPKNLCKFKSTPLSNCHSGSADHLFKEFQSSVIAPKFSLGKARGSCGKCSMRQVLQDGQWNRWNGYDVTTKSGRYVAHVLNENKCKSNPKVEADCEVPPPPPKEDAVPEAQGDAKACVWGSQKILYNSSLKCASEAQAICVGQMVCENGKKLSDVACAVDEGTKVCPVNPEDCDKADGFGFDPPAAAQTPSSQPETTVQQ